MSLESFLYNDGKYSLEEFSTKYPLKYCDWRLPENRIEAFKRVYDTRIREGELDHWLAGKIIVDVMNLSNEQKAWYSMIFGFSYRNHWAMIVLQKFPEIWNTPKKEIADWYNGEDGVWSRVCFAKDTKWNVRKFPDFIESLQKFAGNSLYQTILNLSSSLDKNKNFDSLNDSFQKELYGIGRMTSWLALQTLYEFFDLNIDKWDFQLKNPATWSQYGALCYLADVSEWLENKKQTIQQIEYIERFADDLMVKLNLELPYHVDIFNVESCLCEFRKAWAKEKPKEFTFWTAAELIVEFDKLYDLWKDFDPSIDWTPYVLGLLTKGDHISFGYDPIYFQIPRKTGLNFNTHYYYSDEPNAYDILRIPSKEDLSHQGNLIKSMYNNIDSSLRNRIREEYHPSKHTRWKL